jgi:DNA primase
MSGRISQTAIEDLLGSITISSVISPHVALKRRGREHVGLCPFHNERSASFTVNDEKGFAHCFGCGFHGRHLDFIMRFAGLSFPDALQRLADGSGFKLDERIDRAERERRERERQERAAKIAAEEIEAFTRARAIFKGGRHPDETPGGLYLQRRRITIRPASVVYVDDADMLPEINRKRGALVVAMRNTATGEFAAIQRIYVNSDGTPVKVKEPDSEKLKSLKLSLGYVQGAAAMLSQPPSPDGTWGLTEGFESDAAVIQLFGVSSWAAVSSGNMQNIKPPSWAKRAHIFADHDANRAGFNAAIKARAAWIAAGCFQPADIKIFMVDEVGKDHADLLLAERAA